MILPTIIYNTIYKRLLHTGKDVVIKAYKAAGIKLKETSSIFYKPYVLAKASNVHPKQLSPVAKNPVKFVKVNVITYKEVGHLGYKYTIHFVNAVSNYH